MRKHPLVTSGGRRTSLARERARTRCDIFECPDTAVAVLGIDLTERGQTRTWARPVCADHRADLLNLDPNTSGRQGTPWRAL